MSTQVSSGNQRKQQQIVPFRSLPGMETEMSALNLALKTAEQGINGLLDGSMDARQANSLGALSGRLTSGVKTALTARSMRPKLVAQEARVIEHEDAGAIQAA